MGKMLLCLSLVLVASSAVGRDRPGTPNNVRVAEVKATSLNFSWNITSRRDEYVKFEVEMTKNGVPVGVAQPDGTSGTGSAWLSRTGYSIIGLEPEQKYCLRVWSRYIDNDVRSGQPSGWACSETLANPPLAPLDVQATFTTGANKAYVAWNTPDQSNHRPIATYVIERQSPPGPNRPTLKEGQVKGPNGAQTTTTKLSFVFASSTVKLPGDHGFRVCSLNNGGRACSAFVAAKELSYSPKVYEQNRIVK